MLLLLTMEITFLFPKGKGSYDIKALFQGALMAKISCITNEIE